MKGARFVLVREVTRQECPWLKRTWQPGDEVFEFRGATYGCITPTGVACSVDGHNPFFELPGNALVIKPDSSPVAAKLPGEARPEKSPS